MSSTNERTAADVRAYTTSTTVAPTTLKPRPPPKKGRKKKRRARDRFLRIPAYLRDDLPDSEFIIDPQSADLNKHASDIVEDLMNNRIRKTRRNPRRRRKRQPQQPPAGKGHTGSGPVVRAGPPPSGGPMKAWSTLSSMQDRAKEGMGLSVVERAVWDRLANPHEFDAEDRLSRVGGMDYTSEDGGGGGGGSGGIGVGGGAIAGGSGGQHGGKAGTGAKMAAAAKGSHTFLAAQMVQSKLKELRSNKDVEDELKLKIRQQRGAQFALQNRHFVRENARNMSRPGYPGRQLREREERAAKQSDRAAHAARLFSDVRAAEDGSGDPSLSRPGLGTRGAEDRIARGRQRGWLLVLAVARSATAARAELQQQTGAREHMQRQHDAANRIKNMWGKTRQQNRAQGFRVAYFKVIMVLKRYQRQWKVRRRQLRVDYLKRFLEVCLTSKLQKVMHTYRHKVMKCQRYYRAFRVCKQARVAALSHIWDALERRYAATKVKQRRKQFNEYIKQFNIDETIVRQITSAHIRGGNDGKPAVPLTSAQMSVPPRSTLSDAGSTGMDRRKSYFLNRQLIDGLHKMLSSDADFIFAVPKSLQTQLIGDLLTDWRRVQLRSYKPSQQKAPPILPADALLLAAPAAVASMAHLTPAPGASNAARPVFVVYSRVTEADIWPLVKRGHALVEQGGRSAKANRKPLRRLSTRIPKKQPTHHPAPPPTEANKEAKGSRPVRSSSRRVAGTHALAGGGDGPAFSGQKHVVVLIPKEWQPN